MSYFWAMRLVIPAACIAVLASGVGAQGLRLPDVVRLTLERQPQLSEDSLDLVKARGQVDLLQKKVILPRFEVTVGFGPAPGFRYNPVLDSSGRKVDSSRQYAWWPLGPAFGTDVSIGQPLNVGKLRAGMRAARAGARAAQADLEAHRQDQVKKTLEYLFGLQYAVRMVDLLSDASTRLDSVEKVLQDKLDNDEEGVSQTDLYQLQTGRFELEKGLQEARLGRDRALTGLAFSLSMPADSIHLDDSLLQPLGELPSFDTLDLGMRHPDLYRLQAGLEAKKALVDVERLNLGPDIYLFAKFSYTKAWVANRNQQNQDVLITDPLNDISGMVGLGFTWHLNFWNQLGNVHVAELEWQQLRRKEAYARNGLSSMLKEAWLRYRTLGERIESARKARSAADAWLRTVGQQVDIDPSKAKDLVGPYKTWLDFQNKYWEAVYQRNLVALEVLQGSGILLRWPEIVGSPAP